MIRDPEAPAGYLDGWQPSAGVAPAVQAPRRVFADDVDRARWARYRIQFDLAPAAIVARELGVAVDQALELANRSEARS